MFATAVEKEATGDSRLNDSPGVGVSNGLYKYYQEPITLVLSFKFWHKLC